MKKCIALIYLLLAFLASYAQTPEDMRLVGIVSFATDSYQDSLAAKFVYAAVSRIMVQTGRFTVLEVERWKQTQDEIDRQKGSAFIEQDIIRSGKSLGARILVIGYVKNAELYHDGSMYAARVDYELRFVDVETGKSIAASSFKGDSENMLNTGVRTGRAIGSAAISGLLLGNPNAKKFYLAGAGLAAMSEADKKAVLGKLVDAIESTTGKVNAWVRNTFEFNLLFLKTIGDEDRRRGFEYVLIEGGENIGMKQGYKLKMVVVTETETSRGRIRDEEPVAELEVDEVRAQTSKCKVLSGGRNINDNINNKSLRVVFNN